MADTAGAIVRHDPGQKLSDAVECSGVVHLAGQVAGNLFKGMKAQTGSALRQTDKLLATRGSARRIRGWRSWWQLQRRES